MDKYRTKNINYVLLKVIFLRLLLPMIILSFIVIILAAKIGFNFIETKQKQNVIQVARNIDLYLEQSTRVLDAVSRVAQSSNDESILNFMNSTWEAYEYFDTIYSLDEDSKVEKMVPYDSKYIGIDLSNLKHFENESINGVVISNPFISLRTGEPTVYIIIQLKNINYIVGELNLKKLQEEVVQGFEKYLEEEIFILDKSGTLLAHPNSKLVRQQVNQSNLEILKNKNENQASLIYNYEGSKVIGSMNKSSISGWIVVTQVKLLTILRPYIMGLIYILILFSIFWGFLIFSIRKSLKSTVVEPLKMLSEGTSILAKGDFLGVEYIETIPKTFEELSSLIRDFSYMGNELLNYNQELESKVNERTMELYAMNEELTAINIELNDTLENLQLTQKQLIESEKIAALGSLVAGVSHEINTPVGVALTAASYLDSINKSTVESIYNSKLTKKELIDYLDSVKETTDILNINLEKAVKLIQSFKDIAVDRSTDRLKEIYIKDYINTIILSLKHEYKNKTITFKVDCDEMIKINTYPGEFSQVITNLIMNSLIHGFKNKTKGSIIIKVYKDIDFINIEFEDDGGGIKSDILHKIFNPFFTTNRSGGSTGLGLSVVYNILKSKLEGDIYCISNLDNGTKFILKIKNIINNT